MNSVTDFPRSMQLCGLSPQFTQKEWDVVMSIPRSQEIRNLAYQEWLALQDPIHDNSPWRWYLSYLHGSGIIPLYKHQELPQPPPP